MCRAVLLTSASLQQQGGLQCTASAEIGRAMVELPSEMLQYPDPVQLQPFSCQ